MAATLDLETSEDWVKFAERPEILPELNPAKIQTDVKTAKNAGKK